MGVLAPGTRVSFPAGGPGARRSAGPEPGEKRPGGGRGPGEAGGAEKLPGTGKDPAVHRPASGIRKGRLERLEAILEGDEAAREDYAQVSAFLYRQLLDNGDKRWSQDFITRLLERYPDIWQELGSAKGLPSRTRKALAQAEQRKIRQAQPRSLEELGERINGLPASGTSSRKALDYLVTAIQKERPQYSRNLILNLLICTHQGFLTVFSGAPGSGKTSFCNLLGKVLGLTQFDRKTGPQDIMSTANRYVPVSVERGWTSKRDLIGYYNPLTRTFEESNREVYDGLRLLDWEKTHGVRQYPYYILLDEAICPPWNTTGRTS